MSARWPSRASDALALCQEIEGRLAAIEAAGAPARTSRKLLAALDGCLSDFYLASGAAELFGWRRAEAACERLDRRIKELLQARLGTLPPEQRLELIRAARLLQEEASEDARTLRAGCLQGAFQLEQQAEGVLAERLTLSAGETCLDEVAHRLRDPSYLRSLSARDLKAVTRKSQAAKAALYPTLAELLNQRHAQARAAGHRNYLEHALAGDPLLKGAQEVRAALVGLRAFRARLVPLLGKLEESDPYEPWPTPREELLAGLWDWLERTAGISVQLHAGAGAAPRSLRLQRGRTGGWLLLDAFARRGKAQGEWFTWGRVRTRTHEPDGWVVASLPPSGEGSVWEAAHLLASLAHEFGHAAQFLLNRSVSPFSSCARTTPASCIEVASYVFQLGSWPLITRLQEQARRPGLRHAFVKQLLHEVDRILRGSQVDLELHRTGGWTVERLETLERRLTATPLGLLTSLSFLTSDEYAGRYACYAVSLQVASTLTGPGERTEGGGLEKFVREVLAVHGTDPLVRLAGSRLRARQRKGTRSAPAGAVSLGRA